MNININIWILIQFLFINKHSNIFDQSDRTHAVYQKENLKTLKRLAKFTSASSEVKGEIHQLRQITKLRR